VLETVHARQATSKYISTATTTLIVTGPGVLERIIIGETAAGAITVYDNTAGSGTILIAFKASVAEGTYECGIPFGTGCTVVTAAASKLAVVCS